ncbi:uncharacterized protein LOC121420675 [Lytechinus variegatus]|uniref:uncharacterized protein LOC121420675 n=1 Tax=Lytechinus variegatus TaxID=7654 RepID=UPI001BB22A1D|nr:uncharacterized protein LOC121420675 [Lytechinus variegatus]
MANAGGIVVAFLSLSTESCVDQLIERINTGHGLDCIFVKLTHRDLQFFMPQDEYDAVVLLHSISQGRNSITDVADAKYNKLLLKLKEKYGPDRVGVIVHSMTSYSPVSKSALMMVFKKSQPTTFKCSNYVIQCNNPAKMEDEHISHLIEFLKNAPHHEKPKPLLEGSTSAARLSEATTTNIARPDEHSHSSGEIPETKSTSAASDKNSVTRHEDSSPDNENPALQITRGKAGGREDLEHTDVSASKDRKTLFSTASAADAPMEIDDSKEGTEVPQNTRPTRDPPANFDRHMPKAGKADMSSLPHPLSQDPHEPSVSLSLGSYSEKAGGSNSSGFSQHRSTTSSDDAYSSAAVREYPHPKSHGYGQATSAKTQPSTPLESTVDQHAANVMASQQKIISEKCAALAFFDLSRRGNHSVSEAVRKLFPQRTLMPHGDWKELEGMWHMYTAILIDVGISPTSELHRDVLLACLDNMYDRQNVAILFPASTTGPVSEPEKNFYHLVSTSRVFYFPYYPDSGRFGDDAKKNLVHWLSDCSLRHYGNLHRKNFCTLL